MRVLILAAGEARRMDGTLKQLLPTRDGEPILCRIQRQVQARGVEPVVVTHKREIARASAWWYEPRARRYTAETLYSTAELWEERTAVLLGDVIYSRDLMDRVFNARAQVKVLGHEFEVFAVVFGQRMWPRVRKALRETVHHAENGGPGKLRTFYQAMARLPMGGNAVEGRIFDRVCYIADYSMDVDSPEDFVDMRRKVREGRLNDE